MNKPAKLVYSGGVSKKKIRNQGKHFQTKKKFLTGGTLTTFLFFINSLKVVQFKIYSMLWNNLHKSNITIKYAINYNIWIIVNKISYRVFAIQNVSSSFAFTVKAKLNETYQRILEPFEK